VSVIKRVVIEPVTRVEGHGKVTILLDESGKVVQPVCTWWSFAASSGSCRPAFLGNPVLVQRLCGICRSVTTWLRQGDGSHRGRGEADTHRGKAAPPDALRQMYQSHALHFFHLASPDLLSGRCRSRDPQRHWRGGQYPELAVQAVMMRNYGQEISRPLRARRSTAPAPSRRGQQEPGLASAMSFSRIWASR